MPAVPTPYSLERAQDMLRSFERHRAAGILLAPCVAVITVGAVLLGGATAASASTTTVGRWHMDEEGGRTMNDSSGLGNDGSISSGVTLDRAGASGRAYRFTTGHVTVPDDDSLDPGSATITLRASIKLLSSVPAPTEDDDFDIVRKGTSTSAGGYYKMEVTDRALCAFRFGGVTHVVRSTATVKRDDAFHTYRCRKTASSISVTLDGTTTSSPVGRGSISSSSPVIVGAKSTSGGDQTNAVVDEVSVSVG